jgi:hypothetical protein
MLTQYQNTVILTTLCSTKAPEAKIATHASPFNSIPIPPLYTLPRSSHFPKIFCNDILDPNWELPIFCVALDGCPTRMTCGNLSSFVRRTCPIHLNLFLIVTLDSDIGPIFGVNLLFEIQSDDQNNQWTGFSLENI